MNNLKILDLKNKNVLVTGSTRGIGHAIGKSFLENDCNVIFTGRKKKDLSFKYKFHANADPAIP